MYKHKSIQIYSKTVKYFPLHAHWEWNIISAHSLIRLEHPFLSFTTAICETMRPVRKPEKKSCVSDHLARQTVRYTTVKTSVMTDSTYCFTSSAHVTHHYNDSHAPGDCISSAISLQVHSGNFNFSELERFWQQDTPRNSHIKTHPEKCRAFPLNLGSCERNRSKQMR